MRPRSFLKGCIGLAVAWVAVTGTVGTGRLLGLTPSESPQAPLDAMAEDRFSVDRLASQATWIFAPPAILLALAGLLHTGQGDGNRPNLPMPRERHWGSPGRGVRPPVRRL